MKGLSKEEEEKLIPPNTILLGYVGSISNGTYRPNIHPNSVDDKDIMGIAIAPIETYFGLGNFQHKITQYKQWDCVIYELQKMFRLLLNSNPNVLSLLWLHKNYYIHKDEFGQMIIDNRDLFSSKKIYHSFTGYAHSQLKKITHKAFKGYMGEKRKTLVEKHGYDCCNAAHLIRLLRMGIEFLTEKQLYVLREDAVELLDIKDGKWSLDKIYSEADRLFALANECYIRSDLPNQPDKARVEELLIYILENHFNKKSYLRL